MGVREEALETGRVYHIFNKSIGKYTIFNNSEDFWRMLHLLMFYQQKNPVARFSDICRSKNFSRCNINIETQDKIVKIIAYCIMPTHFHLILRQEEDNGISLYMRKVLNGYSKYFNIRHRRHGPLWQHRFKNVLVETDEQLIHLTRYIHLNPISANLVNSPDSWKYSSYQEYINCIKDKICEWDDLLDINHQSYKAFVLGQQEEQKKLAIIKRLLLD